MPTEMSNGATRLAETPGQTHSGAASRLGLGVSEVAAAQATLLVDLPQHGPGLAMSAAEAAILVRLTELASLVLTVG